MLKDKNILLCITGSIAAYKGADLASRLTREGARVDVIMTDTAASFISPLILSSLTKRKVHMKLNELNEECRANHIALGQGADLIIIAPATAATIARIATGMADDLLSCAVLAATCPVLISPAMNDKMYCNKATQANIATLKERGFHFVGPSCGTLACGVAGRGRFIGTAKICGAASRLLGASGIYAGKKVVVTAGGTRENMDPVRFIGNRSSGKMGNAIALKARDEGAEVTLITSGILPEEQEGLEIITVESAADMKEAVLKEANGADMLIMAAAVADFKPFEANKEKIKKSNKELNIKLVRTDDILSMASGVKVKVGFAAESENLEENALAKLEDKKLDMVVANDITIIGGGFNSGNNEALIIERGGKCSRIPLISKLELAEVILEKAVKYL